MASATYLSNPEVTVGGVTLTDMCSAATLNHLVEALEDSVFGNLSRTYTGGLANNEVTLTFFASYAASETYASLSALVGTKTTLAEMFVQVTFPRERLNASAMVHKHLLRYICNVILN